MEKIELTGEQALKLQEIFAAANVSIDDLGTLTPIDFLNKAYARVPDFKNRIVGEVATKLRKELATELGLQVNTKDPNEFLEGIKSHIESQKTDAGKSIELAVKEALKDKEAAFTAALQKTKSDFDAKEQELSLKLSKTYEKQREAVIKDVISKATTGKNIIVKPDMLDTLAKALINSKGIEFEFTEENDAITSTKIGGVPLMNGINRVPPETTIQSVLLEAGLISEGAIPTQNNDTPAQSGGTKITNDNLW